MLISDTLRDRLIEAVDAAHRRVMAIYHETFEVEYKDDHSPVTEADRAAHHLLVDALTALTPDVPVLSEESEAPPYAVRQQWARYWLIDPLDGTRSFVRRTGEFTVNIALIEHGEPVFGMVGAPVTGTVWWGDATQGAWKRDAEGQVTHIACRALPTPATADHPWRIVGSMHSGRTRMQAFCEALPPHETLHFSSSFKFCMIAEGVADLYPRLAPTSEWDTAAAHAILRAAGGDVFALPDLTPLRYNQKASLLNPEFIACSSLTDTLKTMLQRLT